ncbi:hypothetical protein GCM10027341_32430 [Spirosoma knui]
MRRTGWIAIGMVTMLAVTAPAGAMSTVDFGTKQVKPTAEGPIGSDNGKLTRNPTLARNTTKVEAIAKPETAKPAVEQDKKAIGRYWKRLMNMVREINHAHRNKSK